jgi:hypothetical protein
MPSNSDASTAGTIRVRATSAASILASVPHLLGFMPERSMVVIGVAAPGNQVKLTLRFDLPDPASGPAAGALARHALAVLAAQRIGAAIAVGYGPRKLVTPLADALRREAPSSQVDVKEILRAEGGRYWSYVCTNPSCCPPTGIPYDAAGHPAAVLAAASSRGVLSSREELAETIASAEGDEAASMRRATRAAEDRAGRLRAHAAEKGTRREVARAMADTGRKAVADAIGWYRAGESFPSHADAAWLTVMLNSLRVRDDAWARMDPEFKLDHLRLWADLTRLARPGHIAAPAALLAFTAWQSGSGALANLALDRALADSPAYSMARLLRDTLDAGAPPSMARLPMTPEDVAASYDVDAEDEDSDPADESADDATAGNRSADEANGDGDGEPVS